MNNFLIFPIFVIFLLSGCAEKRQPDDELVREYLYSIKTLELWLPVPPESVSLDEANKIMDQKFLRNFMRISEMATDKYTPICVSVATKSLEDAGFFMNNSKGRIFFEDLTALRKKSPDEYEKLVKERCNDSLLLIKGRANRREFNKRKSLATDNPWKILYLLFFAILFSGFMSLRSIVLLLFAVGYLSGCHDEQESLD